MHDDDPHESVTIAPPAPNFDEMLRNAMPEAALSQHSDEHFRAALDAGSRAGSSLGELSKIVAELSGGLSGAKHANEQLVHELSTLRAMLVTANEQQLAQSQRIAVLEQELRVSQSAAERERQVLTAQHDDFLAALLEEHEEALRARDSQGDTLRVSGEVAELAQRLARTEAARVAAEAECARAREALAKLQTQRDEAQARADKRERERDELRAEASQLRARLGTHRANSTAPPPPLTNSRPPTFRLPLSLELDTSELDSTLHPRSASPRLPPVRPRLTPAPAQVERAVDTSGSAQSAALAAPFPRESTRPGVGGPKPTEPPPPPSFGPPPSGWTPPPPPPDAGPPPRPALVSAASLPPGLATPAPILKQKPHPSTRPLIDYSLGGDGVLSETLEGARISSKPPQK